MTEFPPALDALQGDISRRGLLRGVGIAAAGVAVGSVVTSATRDPAPGVNLKAVVPFFDAYQAGVATPPPDHFILVSFDVTASDHSALRAMLNQWTDAAEKMSRGESVGYTENPYIAPIDSGEADGLSPASLTFTIGYGASLFDERFGLSTRRPAGLQPIPAFVGDNLNPLESDGDIVVQICSEDPQVNFHAAHTLARLGEGVVGIRYMHIGFGRTSAVTSDQATTRNLIGFKDGTNNLQENRVPNFDRHIWVKSSNPAWMHNGTYLVSRKIRVRLEDWSSNSLDTQEATIGRFKDSGAPLTGTLEHDVPNLKALNPHRNYVIPTSAHIRVAAPSQNGGRVILRRGFGFVDGIDQKTGQIICGLHFVCFQRDPIDQFVSIQQNLATNDSLASYLSHEASVLVACPGGLRPGEQWGSQLFD